MPRLPTGVAEHALPLETPAQAARFNRRLVNACLRAHMQKTAYVPVQLHVALGSGATGTELAAELHRTTREVVAYRARSHRPGARHPHPARFESAYCSRPAETHFRGNAPGCLKKWVSRSRTGARVAEVTADRAARRQLISSLGAGGLDGGRKDPEVLRLGDKSEMNRVNQLVVEPKLKPSPTAIFSRSGGAARPSPRPQRVKSSRPVRRRAQAAHQEASQIWCDGIKRTLRTDHKPRIHPSGFTRPIQHGWEPYGPACSTAASSCERGCLLGSMYR